MNKKNERENADISNNNETLEENNDNISKLIKNEQEFIDFINKLLESEFKELFPKILNLPKIDFLNQLTSNVSYILSEHFTKKIFDNDKCMSLITSACRSFDKVYNKYMEELSEGWDQYNFEKINQIQNPLNENIESFLLTKFRKHCIHTQNYAVHQCNKSGETGNFIVVYENTSSDNTFNEIELNENNKNKIKYVICDNCRKSYFINKFHNFCENCKTSYLCGPLIKDEDENLLPATFNPPHCETFVNEEILCEKCKNKLYIDLKNNNLICGNKNCDYNIPIENNKNFDFKCKMCNKHFSSNVKIFNPLEITHFKDIINKALLYKRKAYPGKLSCCKRIKEKRTDFFHKKDCKGNLYFVEYNQKIILVCSKCKAVNLYSKYIWTCPECGLHFRDKKSEENEIKIRKTKSSNKLIKNKKLFPNLDEENFLTLNTNKRSFAEILNKRKLKYEKYSLYGSYTNNNYDDSKTERKRNSKVKFLSEKKLSDTENSVSIDKNLRTNGVERKKKRRYIFGKILPWGTPRKNSSDIEENNDKDKNNEKKEYYDKKVSDLIESKEVPTESDKKKEEDNLMYLCKSGRVNSRYNDSTIDEKSNGSNQKEENKKIKEKEKNVYVRNFNGINNLKNNYESVKNPEIIKFGENTDINTNQTTIEINYAFNRKKSPENKNAKKDNDLKCKKFIPIKLKYLHKEYDKTEKEKETINKKNNENKENNFNDNETSNLNYYSNNHKKILNLFEFHRIKKENIIDLKRNNINQEKNNKESWQSKETKETTTKGSIESKNSIFSHSPPKEEEEDNKKNNKSSLFINNNNYSNNSFITIQNITNKKIDLEKEDDIIPFEMVDLEQDIPIDNKTINEDKSLYIQMQRKLKKILLKGRLPRFDLDKFSVDKQIGDGSFGVIYLVHHNKSKRKYAMKKILANSMNSLESFQKEFEIAHHNPHPAILDIKGICVKCFDSTTFILYVLMDLAEKDWEVEINDRQKYKNYYREKELISILKQLSGALYFLQKEKNIAHRDIKPENVLIFKNKSQSRFGYGESFYKLCDFGEAKDYALIRSRKNKTLRGTELYMSPALYNGLLHDATYVNHDAYKSDVFSLGCCMIIAANLDFDIINEIRELKEQVKIENFLNEKMSGKYSDKFIDVVLKMINFNEKERIDFIQLEEIIESKF